MPYGKPPRISLIPNGHRLRDLHPWIGITVPAHRTRSLRSFRASPTLSGFFSAPYKLHPSSITSFGSPLLTIFHYLLRVNTWPISANISWRVNVTTSRAFNPDLRCPLSFCLASFSACSRRGVMALARCEKAALRHYAPDTPSICMSHLVHHSSWCVQCLVHLSYSSRPFRGPRKWCSCMHQLASFPA